jgi:uncharacterized protein
MADTTPEPMPSGGPEAQFRVFLKQGRFMLQRSRSTGRHVFYPRVALPGTGETDLDWVEASGAGTVHATTVNRGREGHSNLAIVELAEGPRMMSRVEGLPPEAVTIGLAVRARIAVEDGAEIILFDPAPSDRGGPDGPKRESDGQHASDRGGPDGPERESDGKDGLPR